MIQRGNSGIAKGDRDCQNVTEKKKKEFIKPQYVNTAEENREHWCVHISDISACCDTSSCGSLLWEIIESMQVCKTEQWGNHL